MSVSATSSSSSSSSVTRPLANHLAAFPKMEELSTFLKNQDWVNVKKCTDELFGLGRRLVALHVANKNHPFNPLPITIEFFKALNSHHIQLDREAMLHVTRAGRLFIELTYMKYQNEQVDLYERDKSELKGYLDLLISTAKEEEVGLVYELKCCIEAYKQMDLPDYKEFAVNILKVFATQDVKSIITGAAPILLDLLKHRPKLWYADSLYVSWVGPLAVDNLKLLREIRQGYSTYCDTIEIAQTFVELYGYLIWKGTDEVQREALEGLLSLSGKFKRDKVPPFRDSMWPVRKRVVEILVSITGDSSTHPSLDIAGCAADALLERRREETDKRVLVLLEQLDTSKNVRARWSAQLTRTRSVLQQKSEKDDQALAQREAELRAKEAELEQRKNLLAANSVEALEQVTRERERLLQESAALAQEKAKHEQQAANMKYLYETLLDEVSSLASDTAGGTMSHSASSKQSSEDLLRGKNLLRGVSGPADVTNAVIRFEQAASGRNKVAEFYMGFIYSTDRSSALKQDLENAIGDELAKDLLLLWDYRSDSLYPRNNSKSQDLLEKSAVKGVPIAVYFLGRQYGAMGNYKQAFQWYEKGATAGHPPSLNALANCYENELGVARDLEKAFTLYGKAAQGSYLVAECNLARCLVRGIGTKLKPLEGFKRLERPAQKQLPEALYQLAYCYEQGYGTSKSFKHAFTNYLAAAEKKHPEAQCFVGITYYLGREGVVEKNYAEAVRWTREAVGLHSAEGQFNLGNFYIEGKAVEKDPQQAISCFVDAAEKNHVDAMLNLGEFSAKGLFTMPKDEAKAREWYEKAAALGSAIAKERLARMNRPKASNSSNK